MKATATHQPQASLAFRRHKARATCPMHRSGPQSRRLPDASAGAWKRGGARNLLNAFCPSAQFSHPPRSPLATMPVAVLRSRQFLLRPVPFRHYLSPLPFSCPLPPLPFCFSLSPFPLPFRVPVLPLTFRLPLSPLFRTSHAPALFVIHHTSPSCFGARAVRCWLVPPMKDGVCGGRSDGRRVHWGSGCTALAPHGCEHLLLGLSDAAGGLMIKTR